MLFKINYDQSDVVLTLVVDVALVRYFFRDLLQRVLSRITHLVDHSCYLRLTENIEETISGQDEQVILWLDLVSVGLWLWDQKLLVLEISYGPTDRQASIYSGNVILDCDKSIVSDDPVVFVVSVRSLLIS
jgi:hypothetical protein